MSDDDMWDATPKPMSAEDRAYFEREARLEEACNAALDRITGDLDEHEVAIAQGIVADFVGKGERMPLYRVRDRLRLIVRERQERQP